MFTSARARGFGRTLDPFDARDGGPVRSDVGQLRHVETALPNNFGVRPSLPQRITAPDVITPVDPTKIPGRINSGGGTPPVAAGTPPVDVVVGSGEGATPPRRFPFVVVGLLLAAYLLTKD